MKGFTVGYGYIGWVPGETRYRLFVTEGEYSEYYYEICEDNSAA